MAGLRRTIQGGDDPARRPRPRPRGKTWSPTNYQGSSHRFFYPRRGGQRVIEGSSGGVLASEAEARERSSSLALRRAPSFPLMQANPQQATHETIRIAAAESTGQEDTWQLVASNVSLGQRQARGTPHCTTSCQTTRTQNPRHSVSSPRDKTIYVLVLSRLQPMGRSL